MTKRHNKLILSVVAIALVGVVAISALALAKRSVIQQPTEIFIPTSTDYPTLISSLSEAGVERMEIVSLVGRLKKLDQHIKPGHYILPEGASAMRVVNMLRGGAQTPVKLTFNNTRTIEELSARIAEQIEADSSALATYLKEPSTAAKYDLRPEELIALFIPNTYEVWWTVTPEQLTDRMAREWERFWNESRMAKLQRTGLSQVEVVTLASIVYEETKNVGEMAKIAGVYINRLRRGMPLQACPTAKYAIGDFTIKRVLHKHTQVRSPYNTYLNRGLTPGPICVPSIAAIDAVLNYSTHNYLYFCAKEDFSGTHNFSTNLAQHNRYAKRYSDALRKAGIR